MLTSRGASIFMSESPLEGTRRMRDISKEARRDAQAKLARATAFIDAFVFIGSTDEPPLRVSLPYFSSNFVLRNIKSYAEISTSERFPRASTVGIGSIHRRGEKGYRDRKDDAVTAAAAIVVGATCDAELTMAEVPLTGTAHADMNNYTNVAYRTPESIGFHFTEID